MTDREYITKWGVNFLERNATQVIGSSAYPREHESISICYLWPFCRVFLSEKSAPAAIRNTDPAAQQRKQSAARLLTISFALQEWTQGTGTEDEESHDQDRGGNGRSVAASISRRTPRPTPEARRAAPSAATASAKRAARDGAIDGVVQAGDQPPASAVIACPAFAARPRLAGAMRPARQGAGDDGSTAPHRV